MKARRTKDGERFNMLTILDEFVVGKYRKVVCKCDCGLIKEIYFDAVKSGASQSCGCYRTKRSKEVHTVHGMSKTKVYKAWEHMLYRCNKKTCKEYKNYGSRGIKVCDRWMKFENFYEDMKEGYSGDLTIDRIDNDGDYEPDNCRWTTSYMQSRNTRRTRMVEFKGVTMCVKDWCTKLQLHPSSIYKKISKGENELEALNLL